MPGRTAREAARSHAEVVRRSLLCVAHGHVRFDSPHITPDEQFVLNDNRPILLAGSVAPIALRVIIRYALIERPNAPTRERWDIVPSGYAYNLEHSTTETEYLAFHWHPGSGGIAFPHVHIDSSMLSDNARRGFSKMHLPTGQLALEDVLLLAVRDLGVQPQRADWQAVLTAGRSASIAAFRSAGAERAT